MEPVQEIRGVVQHYAWGDAGFIPRLLGQEVDGQPWAEWWIGTHPNGPATLLDGRPLSDVTGPLPYLLKVLAAAEPLSLQTHPDQEQAQRGFDEGHFGDRHAKPELLRALTPFEALCGVRSMAATLELLDELGTDALAHALRTDGFLGVLESLLRGGIDVDQVISTCAHSERPEAAWVVRLRARWPDDPSVIAPLLLNYVVLEPGEALRLDAGNLHAYLRGAGIELMGASDNVVRCGLTDKLVDTDLLLAVIDPSPIADPVIPTDARHDLPTVGVELTEVAPGAPHVAIDHEVALDLAGRAWYVEPGSTATFDATAYVVTSTQRASRVSP